MIAIQAQDTYTRLLAGSLSMTFFVYFIVNTGMVTGLLRHEDDHRQLRRAGMEHGHGRLQ